MNPNDFFNKTEQHFERQSKQFDDSFNESVKILSRGAKRGATVAGILILANIVCSIAALFGFVYFIFWCCRHFGIIGN